MHKRKPNRLKEYDYNTPAKYFVTLCTQNRQCLFEMENIVGNDLRVVPCLQNQIIHKWVNEIENKFEEVTVEKYIIMPDHVHFIIFISSIEDKTNNTIYTERHAGRSIRMPWDCPNFTERHIGRSLRVPWGFIEFDGTTHSV